LTGCVRCGDTLVEGVCPNVVYHEEHAKQGITKYWQLITPLREVARARSGHRFDSRHRI
jgi:hypothetical protein